MIWQIILVIFILYLLVVSGIMFFFATKFGLVNTIVQWEKEDTFYIFCPIIHLFTLYFKKFVHKLNSGVLKIKTNHLTKP